MSCSPRVQARLAAPQQRCLPGRALSRRSAWTAHGGRKTSVACAAHPRPGDSDQNAWAQCPLSAPFFASQFPVRAPAVGGKLPRMEGLGTNLSHPECARPLPPHRPTASASDAWTACAPCISRPEPLSSATIFTLGCVHFLGLSCSRRGTVTRPLSRRREALRTGAGMQENAALLTGARSRANRIQPV
jgi:hypothetical protein